MKKLSLIIIVSLLVNCDNVISTNKNSHPVQKFVNDFYKWYLNEIYLKGNSIEYPEFILSSDSVFQLDTAQYIKFLRKQFFFSDTFISNERNKIINCNKELGKIPYAVNKDYAIPSEGIRACLFMEYNSWVGCQGEDVSEVKILALSTIDSMHYRVKLFLCDTVFVELSKWNDVYKIDMIQTKF